MSRTAIHIENLSVSYRHTPALSDVCLDVEEGEFLGIIGPNGGGKTTLLKAILGLVPINCGSISIFGEKSCAGAGIGYVPQFSSANRNFPISVREVVMTAFLKGGLHPFFRYKKEHVIEADEVLDMVGIKALRNRQISQLSGGEFQRLLIARALATKPRILMLDEPTASVDPSSQEHIFELLDELNKKVTILLVTHDMVAASSKVKSLACLNKTLIYHGEPELTEDTLSKIYGYPVNFRPRQGDDKAQREGDADVK